MHRNTSRHQATAVADERATAVADGRATAAAFCCGCGYESRIEEQATAFCYDCGYELRQQIEEQQQRD